MKTNKKALKYIETAKMIDAGDYTLTEAIEIAVDVMCDDIIKADLQKKNNKDAVVWTLTQTGMKMMGLGVI